MALAALACFVAPNAFAGGATAIDGCEAIDMADRVDQHHPTIWRGDSRAFGDWGMVPNVRLTCGGGQCDVRSELDFFEEIDQGPEPGRFPTVDAAESVFFSGPDAVGDRSDNTLQTIYRIEGYAARQLAGIDGAWSAPDGTIRMTHVDHADLNGIQIRTRIATVCAAEGAMCEVGSWTLVGMAYGDDQECPMSVPSRNAGT